MKKLLEVKEFDRITGNPNYENDPDYRYLEEPAFSDLISFIEEFAATNENDDAYDCFKVIKQRGPGEVVTTKNYVGLIQMENGYQVQILPKISMGGSGDSNNKVTKNIFIKMLKCMDDFQSKVFSTANLNIDMMNLYEIFINMYLQEVINLVKHGLKFNYVPEEENISTLRGKLNVQRHVVINSIHKEKFYCNFDEYQVNRPENKIIKSTLIKLNGITERIENKKYISQLLSAFEMVDPSINHDMDLSMIYLDRSMKDYDTVLKWSKVFLKNKSFTTFSGDSVSRALLFPMDKLYEGYVAKHMKRKLGEFGWHVTVQDKGYYLFDNPQQFKLKPDIVVIRDDGSQIIMDTKWKNLHDKARDNYGISQGDMYQMYAYAKKYKTPEIWLIYPVNDEMRNHSQISFESKDDTGNIEAIIKLFFIDVTDIDMSIEELKKIIIERR